MKKHIFTAIIFATATLSCTKSNLVEVPQSQETPITFEVYNGKAPMTKAISIIGATGEPDNGQSLAEAGGFHVTAFKTTDYTSAYFNKDMAWSTNAWAATDNYDVFWPGDATLDFLAFGNNVSDKEVTSNGVTPVDLISPISPATDGSFTQFTYNVPDNVAEQEDLVVSAKVTTKLSETNGGAVQLEMKHILSRIGFKVYVSGSAAVVINEITLYGAFSTSGTVDLTATTPAIAPLENDQEEVVRTPTSYSLLPGDTSFSPVANQTQQIHSGTAENAENCYMMVIPGTVGDYATNTKPYIHIEYTLGGVENEKDIPLTLDNTATGANMVFEAGKAYEYLFTISAAKIDFTGSVVNWDETGIDPGTPLN